MTSARIVLIHSSDELYGADRIVLQVLEALREHTDADVEVWLPSDVEHGEFPLCEQLAGHGYAFAHLPIPVLRRSSLRPAGMLRLGRDSIRTWWRLRRDPPDVVYLASSACLSLAPFARLAGTRRCVLHVQERWEGRTGSILRRLARWTTAQIAISEYVATASGLAEPPVVVPNGVDDASLRATPEPHRSDPALHYLVASRWNRWKGHATLITAWGRAGCPGRLSILGGPPPSGERVDVPALVAQLPDPTTVDIVGEVADIAPYLARADVLVLPSDEPEPFGLVLIEAFSLARPVVASRAGGPLEIVEEGTTGWLFTPGDVAELAALLGSLAPDTVDRAGRAARDAYEADYHPQVFRRRIADVVAGELAELDRS